MKHQIGRFAKPSAAHVSSFIRIGNCALSMTRLQAPPVEIFHEIVDLGEFLDLFLLVQPDRKRLESV